jgi:hypothetical protein
LYWGPGCSQLKVTPSNYWVGVSFQPAGEDEKFLQQAEGAKNDVSATLPFFRIRFYRRPHCLEKNQKCFLVKLKKAEPPAQARGRLRCCGVAPVLQDWLKK